MAKRDKLQLRVFEIYKSAQKMPKSEIFGLISQFKRSAVSISSNIAEGFGRSGKKEKSYFYNIAFGSLLELENQMMICRDLSYITKIKFNELYNKMIEVEKLLNSLIKSVKNYN